MLELNKVKNYAVLILLGLLVWALIRGCQNNNLRVAANSKIDSLVSKGKQNSIKSYNDSVDYADHIQYAEGKLELNYNQYIAATDSIHTLWKKLDKLSAKHINIEPKWDTSIMQVPTEYVSECKECFYQLPIIKATTKYLEVRFDSLKTSAITKYSIQEKRIKQLNAEKSKLTALFSDCIAAANDQKKRYEPRRQLKMLFSPASIGQIFPNAIGLGALYEDKRERDFGGEYFLTPHGPMYVVHGAFPLSLTRKK